MKLIKFYEDYINSNTNILSTLLSNMIDMFMKTFNGENDILSQEETELLTLIEIEKSNTNDTAEKNLIMNFSDTEFFYQVIFIVKPDDIEEGIIDKSYIKIKVYNENSDMLNEYQTNLEMKVSDDDEKLKEGRFFVKVKKTDSGEFDYIENFIIVLVGELKTILNKNN